MFLFLIYTPVVSIKTELFQKGLIELLPIKMFEIHKNDIYDIFHANPHLDTIWNHSK